MANLTFKTNLNCANCVRSVSGFLNGVEGIKKWDVDTSDERKTLSVEGELTKDAVIEAVEDAGFDIEEL